MNTRRHEKTETNKINRNKQTNNPNETTNTQNKKPTGNKQTQLINKKGTNANTKQDKQKQK